MSWKCQPQNLCSIVSFITPTPYILDSMTDPIDVTIAQDGGIMKTILEAAPEGE